MKKLFPLIMVAAILAGCSGGLPDVMSLIVTPTFTPMDTNTPEPTVTLFPTRDLFAISSPTPVTFTPTPSPFPGDDFPTAAPTETPTLFATFVPPLNEIPGSNFFTPKDEGFERILVSDRVLYWNAGPCVTRNVKFNALVSDEAKTHRVLLFLRVREKKNTLNVTEWNSGAIMFKETDGTFSYNLRTFNIEHYYAFKDAWIEYQLVAITNDLRVVGRTKIYDRDLSLVKCNPVP